jgi:glutathionyl-hydroquinone reductase
MRPTNGFMIFSTMVCIRLDSQVLKQFVRLLPTAVLIVDEENVKGVFKAMDRMDEILGKQKYLAGDQLTEADIRAYTTAARFDVAYHGAFKCNLRLLRSYPNLNRWLKSIYWSEEYPEFKETTLFDAVPSPNVAN